MASELLVRRLVVFFLAVSLPVSLLAFAGGKAVAACAAASPEVYLDEADAVVVGTVEQVTVRPRSSLVELRLERVFKGEPEKTVTVETETGSQQAVSTDVQFEEGTRYLLYLQEQGDFFTTTICAGTESVGDELPPGVAASLGEGTVPVATSEPLPETGGSMLPVAALAVVGLVAVGGLSLALWRRTG